MYGVITDTDGFSKYKIIGKYTHSLDVIDLETQETWQIWKSA